MKGARLSGEEREQIVKKLARYTGLTPAYIERANLRIQIHRFTKELLRESGQTVGRLDSRIKGTDRDAAGEFAEFDPSLFAIIGPYTGTFNNYVRSELQFENDLPYEILNIQTNQAWQFDQHKNQFVNVAETLRQAINVNPHLKVLVANGYFDLATPFLATEYTFDHLDIDASQQENIMMTYYPAGHMMYTHLPSLSQLKKDLDAFIASATS